jgi:hypothetical protein
MKHKYICLAAIVWLLVGVALFFLMLPDGMTPAMFWERAIR